MAPRTTARPPTIEEGPIYRTSALVGAATSQAPTRPGVAGIATPSRGPAGPEELRRTGRRASVGMGRSTAGSTSVDPNEAPVTRRGAMALTATFGASGP